MAGIEGQPSLVRGCNRRAFANGGARDPEHTGEAAGRRLVPKTEAARRLASGDACYWRTGFTTRKAVVPSAPAVGGDREDGYEPTAHAPRYPPESANATLGSVTVPGRCTNRAEHSVGASLVSRCAGEIPPALVGLRGSQNPRENTTVKESLVDFGRSVFPPRATGGFVAELRDVTDTTFRAEVLESTLPVLVDFWGNHCAACRQISPILRDLADSYEGRVRIVRLHAAENPSTSARYAIRAMPTVLVFSKGEVVNQLVGARPKAAFVEAIGRVL